MRRRGFSLLEMTVVLCLTALVLGGAYYMLSTGQGASSKGVVLLDELGKQIRLTEQLRRVLRTATAVVHTPKGDGANYDITYVSRIDEEGPTLVTERARLELTTLENGGLSAVFLREHQKPIRYHFLDMMMDIDVGAGNATIRFTSRRSTTSLQLACANLLPSGIPLDPVQRPGPLPPAPAAGPTSFGGSQMTPQSGPAQGLPPGTVTPQSNPVAPPLGPARAGSPPGQITPNSAALGAGPTAASAPGGGISPTGATAPQALSGAAPKIAGASTAGGASAGGTFGPMNAQPTGFASPGAPPEDAGIGDARTPSRPGLPPIRQDRPGDSARKPPRPIPPVGWTGINPGRTATPLSATPAAAPARPAALKPLKPGATAGTPAAAASARPPAARLPGDEVQPVAGGTVDEPF